MDKMSICQQFQENEWGSDLLKSEKSLIKSFCYICEGLGSSPLVKPQNVGSNTKKMTILEKYKVKLKCFLEPLKSKKKVFDDENYWKLIEKKKSYWWQRI
jgi:hypothetical protein